MTAITEALQRLDPANDEHWTGDGLPRIDALAKLDVVATRAEVTAASPQFNREALRAAVADKVATLTQAVVAPDPDGDDYKPAGPGSDANPVEVPPAPRPQPTNAEIDHSLGEAIYNLMSEGRDEVEATKELLAQAEAATELARKRLVAAQKAADEAAIAELARQPARVFSHDIQDYHASQLKLRHEKAGRLTELKANGLDKLRELLPGPSKLDASFQRKNGYGNGRNVRPLMAGAAPEKKAE